MEGKVICTIPIRWGSIDLYEDKVNIHLERSWHTFLRGRQSWSYDFTAPMRSCEIKLDERPTHYDFCLYNNGKPMQAVEVLDKEACNTFVEVFDNIKIQREHQHKPFQPNCSRCGAPRKPFQRCEYCGALV